MSFPTSFTKGAAKQAGETVGQILSITGIHVGKQEQFLAFLTTFSQNFTSTWNSEAVFGRADPIATFQGNQRSISLGWDIPSGGFKEAQDNLKRFGNLAKLIYPMYSQGASPQQMISLNALTLSKPPLIRIKYANLISSQDAQGLLGYITNLSWNPVIEMGFFGSTGSLYPKVVSLNIEFQVLHEEPMGWSTKKTFRNTTFPFEG